MNARNIIVWSTKTQVKKVISTTAETLADLKADLDVAGVDYENMTFFEGLTKTELKADASLLPRDVVYKGNTTNELVIMLTVVNNKISSGMGARQDVYAAIREHDLQEAVEHIFGRNFTQVSTYNLEAVVQSYLEQIAAYESRETPVAPRPESGNIVVALATLIEALFLEETISEETYQDLTEALGATPKELKVGSYEYKELNDMFDFVR